ncbi:MAG: hypothetical protein OHK0046_41880 [Anaerolineae bacterium]
MALTYKGRLPGVVVEPAQSKSDEDSLRMDVPGLVGFAERGPLDTPVRVADIQQYRAVFGEDVFLARDGGKPIFAQLPRAVQAFFDNGGRHAWVVRVAGRNARPNRLRIPGLAAISDTDRGLRTVVRPAAWVGRWSDNLTVATRLRRRPLRVYRPWRAVNFRMLYEDNPDCQTLDVELLLSRIDLVRVNDVLQLSFDDAQGAEVYFRVQQTEQVSFAQRDGALWEGVPVRVSGRDTCVATFGTRFTLPAIKHVDTVEYLHKGEWYPLPPPLKANLTPDVQHGEIYTFDFRVVEEGADNDSPNHDLHPGYCCLCHPNKQDSLYYMPITPENPAGEDDILRLRYKGGLILDFPVRFTTLIQGVFTENTPIALQIGSDRVIFSSDALDSVTVLDDTGWQTISKPLLGLMYVLGSRTQPYRVIFRRFDRFLTSNDILRFALLPAIPEGKPIVFLFSVEGSDWYYNSGNQVELQLYSQHVWHEITPDQIDPSKLKKIDLLSFDLHLREGTERQEHWLDLRFGNTGKDFWEHVLARPSGHEDNASAERILQRSTLLGLPPERDDFATVPFYIPLNMNEDSPHPLSFEVPLPDRQINAGNKDGLDTFSPIALFLDPDFHRSNREERLRPEEIRDLANRKLYFHDPTRPVHLQKPKKLHSLYGIDEVSLIAIPDLGHRRWERVETSRFIPYIPEEPEDTGLIFNPCPEPQEQEPFFPEFPFRRERAQREQFLLESETNTDIYRRLLPLPTLVPAEEDCLCDDADFIVVQRAMVNMAASRFDMTAILSLPLHYDLRDVLDWHQQIVCPREVLYEDGSRSQTSDFCPRDRLDERTLGHAAAYHGWTIVREERTPELDPLRIIPPDGTVLGMIANRTINRGPGIAPANDALRGVIGLSPTLTDAEWEMLFNRQVNVLRQRPQRFTLLSAHTLSLDTLHSKLSIERLHMFIRKLVLREGERYVFETNSERFRRSVQRGFERVMSRLLQQGALVGYSVDATERLNPPFSVDQGRFIVEIKYAPTHPVEFITIVLVRSGESLLEVMEQ